MVARANSPASTELRSLCRGMQRYLLVAQLILLRDELALLVLKAGDVVGRHGHLGRDRQIKEDADQRRAKEKVSVAERAQPQPLGRGRACDLHEAARAPPPARGGGVLRADRA